MTVGITPDHAQLLRDGTAALEADDPALTTLLDREISRQRDTLALVAYASVQDPSVLAAAGTALANVTAEGYPGTRYHPGTDVLDEVENLAVRRACLAFHARYANVQPHSCSSANLAVLFGLLRPGDTLLSLDLDSGGHLTHGANASLTGQAFQVVHYGLDGNGRIDMAAIAEQARAHRPKLIVAGASAYPRRIDFVAFRRIADEVGAYLLADISHVAGLVVAGELPSPIDVAHVTTTSTYKQLGGPRGGLILIGAESGMLGPDGRTSLAKTMQRAVFPRSQGTPNPAAIAAKARALDLVTRPEFALVARRITSSARALAAELTRRGYSVLTGGTDTHMVLVDLRDRNLSGLVAERALQECGILANKNRLPGDTRPPLVTSGLRLGTNVLAQRGMGPNEMGECAELLDRVLTTVGAVDDRSYSLPPRQRHRIRADVVDLCRRFPLSYGEVPA
jgi:glycine hydroxymethyltransferase